ncbi:5-formyltetrahydrofolate cyclo-ligase [Culicoidibacter larvae]|uniref:5-formyltetrahydrofolate cyclo-ligase n=1 Tax=Culicoidibacter larvae TaxID=2579976 RepID=A0A5R8QGD8_9FIRM|nr:5-formyltetrahydrofolate cyclo-ligase [Culicoidibacter larvae]TLG77075.1 5-formyltetrahydrofolate cyclo-ligase [Culicoidibacter larvae]
MESKQQLRDKAKAIRDAIPIDKRKQWSQQICQQIYCDPIFNNGQIIAIFWPIGSEVDVLPLLYQSGKRFVFPRVQGKQMVFAEMTDEHKVGFFGQREPHLLQAAVTPDVVVVPLLAFTESGYRLGYGGGYYDRYLADVKLPTIGVAFDVQKVEELPIESFDVAIDRIITEKQIYVK